MRHSVSLDLLGRGVFQAPWLGPNGELVLLAVRRDHRLNAPPFVVPHGASRISAAESLLDGLDRDDAIPNLKII
jgi:hypothetical protein